MNKPYISEQELVACDICMKEVPLSDAINPETDDYVAHFCGLECYEQWKRQAKKTAEPSDR